MRSMVAMAALVTGCGVAGTEDLLRRPRPFDGGMRVDAGTPRVDAGRRDAGARPDAGRADAGSFRRDASAPHDAGADFPDAEPFPQGALSFAARCPIDDGTTPGPAGIDSSITATFIHDVDARTVGPDALVVTCDGVPIMGRVHAQGQHIELLPAAPLPPLAQCEAVIGGGARSVRGHELVGTFTFETADSDRPQFALGASQRFHDGSFVPTPGVATGDRFQYGLFRMAGGAGGDTRPGLGTARTTDNGRTFVVSATTALPRDVVPSHASFALVGDTVHAVWRVPVNTSSVVLAYARQLDEASGYEPWVALLSQPVSGSVASQHVVSSAAGEVSVLWDFVCSSFNCAVADSGLFRRVSTDHGASFGPVQRLGSTGDIAVAPTDRDALMARVVVDPAGGVALEVSRLGLRIEPIVTLPNWASGAVELTRLDPTRMLVVGGGLFAIFDHDGQVEIPPRSVPGEQLFVAPSGDLFALSGLRTTQRSRDQGLTFEPPRPIRLLHAGGPGIGLTIRMTHDGALLHVWRSTHAARAQLRAGCVL